MRGYFQSMVEAKINKEKFEGGLMLYLTCFPATGKSNMVKITQKEMNLTNLVARMSDVTDETKDSAHNVASRLTQPIIKKSGRREISVDTPLVRQLKNRVPTLYLFDEIDKMRRLDKQLVKSKLGDSNGINSIDEMLRNFIDTGHIAGINASGSVIITTSNETEDDINNLESSLDNRYRPYLVKFKDFNEEDYKEIILRGSHKLQDYYKNTFKANVEWTESALNYFAKKFVNEKASGRCSEPLMTRIRSAIVVLQKSEKIEDKKLLIEVSELNNEIIIKVE